MALTTMGAAVALANGHGHGNGAGQGNGNGGGGATRLEPDQCAILMGWLTSIRLPNGANAYAAYSALKFEGSAQTPLDSVAIVIDQDFPYAAYGGWFLYPTTYKLPTDGATYPNIVPDPGSVNPYTPGTPVFAPKRHYQILMTADSVQQSQLPGSLKNIPNHVTWPQGSGTYTLLGRSYNEKAGYDRGGTGGPTHTAWANIRTYDINTGKPVDCAGVQPSRDLVQRFTPWNTVGFNGFADLPAPLRPAFPVELAPQSERQPPQPDPKLVQFFRLPANGTGLPGGVVPPPTPDNCANYLEAKLIENQIAVIRVPKVPSFQRKDLPSDALYTQTDAGAYVWQINGLVRQSFRPNTPYNYTLANEDIKTDATGGATFVIWPRTLRSARRLAVFAYARAHGWNLLQGNLQSPGSYAESVWIRINGPASTYTGGTYPTASRSGVPCMNGPQSVLDQLNLTQVPPDTAFTSLGAEWAAVPSMMGAATPQGVNCRFVEYLTGRCLTRLQQHIADTGGSYNAN